ncbi:hypothetical protein ACSBR1_016052 [Camellia fascicularis]
MQFLVVRSSSVFPSVGGPRFFHKFSSNCNLPPSCYQIVEDGYYDLAQVLIGNEKSLVHTHLHIVIGDVIVALNTSFQLGLT